MNEVRKYISHFPNGSRAHDLPEYRLDALTAEVLRNYPASRILNSLLGGYPNEILSLAFDILLLAEKSRAFSFRCCGMAFSYGLVLTCGRPHCTFSPWTELSKNDYYGNYYHDYIFNRFSTLQKKPFFVDLIDYRVKVSKVSSERRANSL